MAEAFDGERIARQRIAAEAEQRTGFLDLGGLGLTSLPPELFRLTHLRVLNLGNRVRREDGTWHAAYGSWNDSVPRNLLAGELSQLAQLPELRTLSLADTPLADLTPLAGLAALQSLECGSTLVNDLTPLAGLTALQSLECGSTMVNDLTPLAGLTALQSLDCRNTQVSGLTPLADLTALQSLDCYNTQVSDLTPLAGLTALQSLECGSTLVNDLTPLAGLTALQSLDCRFAPVSDLAPLAGLSGLQTLYCVGAQVSDLRPLEDVSALQALFCGNTRVSDLRPLARLTALRSLDCSITEVSGLTPLAGLTALQSLNCGGTQVSDLAPLAGLTALRSLYCIGTHVSDLTPLTDLSALQSLDCSYTHVSELTPLARLTALQSLDCSYTQVSDLTPLAGLTALQSLDCSFCNLGALPAAVRNIASLQWLVLFQTRIPGIPAEVLSQNVSDNCLAAVRAHFRDQAAGAATATDAKLIVLGNGRVGKTQICRRLRNEPYDDTQPSTHGIQVTSALLDTGDAEPVRLNIWDFGGQDLYHGTHALFLRTSAIFLLVWARETENEQEHTDQGIVFRNQRLPYWLAYVRHLAAKDSPALIVQTRCDRPQDEALAPPIPDDTERPEHCVVLHYSALNDRRRADLDDRLREAVAWLRERQGVAMIGIGRLKVQRALQALRDADARAAPSLRQYRTITPEHFQALCDEAGNVSSPEHLLQYLHNAGIVFHRPGLFRDSIVLDQGWALDAIYAVFNREKCYRELKRLRGRFTRPLLELLVWGGYPELEQRLFLDMMLSCGVCFVHRGERYGERDDDTEYIAPDLLPEREAVQAELDGRWDATLPSESVTFDYAMLHPGLVRGLICEIGGAAGVDALYWRGGVCVYETRTRSHALIEQTMTDGWHGRLTVQAQGGQAAALCDQLAAWIEQRNNRDGLRATRIGPAPAAGAPAIRFAMAELGLAWSAKIDAPGATRFAMAELGLAAAVAADAPPGAFGPAPVDATEYFVSYAWGDDTPAGKDREAIVDRLCAAAQSHGTRIVRDKTTLRTGDRITAFMRRIGRGDRVFVILSDKYLHSAFCMFELLEVWFHSRRDEADFRRRVRVYALPDAQAGTTLQRARLAAWWKQQHDEIAALIKENGAEILATEDFQRFKAMGDFYRHVPDILATLFDTVPPRGFEELERYGFNDTIPH